MSLNKKWIVILLLFVATILAAPTLMAQEEKVTENGEAVQVQENTIGRGLYALAIAIAIAGACIGAGQAVAKVGSAALGAAAENPEMLTRSLLYVALAEGIAIYGLLIAMLLWMKL
jgi:V/A-type H+-transporting ATPase subunit K